MAWRILAVLDDIIRHALMLSRKIYINCTIANDRLDDQYKYLSTAEMIIQTCLTHPLDEYFYSLRISYLEKLRESIKLALKISDQMCRAYD